MRKTALVLLLGSLLVALSSCRGEGASDPDANAGANAAASPGPAYNPAALDGEIARLERLTERNPADDEARLKLARAYVRRADQHRAAQRLPEALAEYRRALRTDPDNEDALRNVAELSPQVEGTPQEGEYGEPAPPPISPNVEGEAKATPEKP